MQITRREKRMLLFSAALAGVWLLYSFVCKPAGDRLETLERVIPEKEAALTQLVSMVREYRVLQNQSAQLQQQIAAQPADFALLAFLENTATQCSLRPSAMEEQPAPPDSDLTDITVSMEFTKISLEPLVRFLSKLRSCQASLKIKSLHITQGGSSDLLNVTVVVSHLTLKPTSFCYRN
jgi:type II secretory pathway component PulM